MPPGSTAKLDTKRLQIERALGRVDVRERGSDLERCVLMADELKLPLGTVAKMMCLSPFRAYRARISMKKKREVGVAGRPRALSKEAEEALSQEIVKCSQRGDPVSYTTFQAKANELHEKDFMNRLPQDEITQRSTVPESLSRSFVYGFVRHHNELKVTKAIRMDQERLDEATPTNIEHYFDQLEDLWKLHDFDQSVVANFDETMIQQAKGAWKVIVPRDCPRPQVANLDGLPHITLGVCIFADQTFAEPLVIYPQKTLPKEIDLEFLESNMRVSFAGQDSGWMTTELFTQYARKVLIPEFQERLRLLPPGSHGLLLLDGHSSRYNPDLWDEFRNNSVDVLTFYSHTSHVVQPLDAVVFGSFKSQLRTFKLGLSRNSLPEKRKHVMEIALKALHSSLYPGYIRTSFRRTGIYPLDRQKLMDHPGIHCIEASDLDVVHTRKPRESIDINAKVLTDVMVIQAMREKIQKKAEKKRKRPQLPDGSPPPKKPRITENTP